MNIDEGVVINCVSAAIKEGLSALDVSFSKTVIEENTDAVLKKERTSKRRKLERIQGLIKGLYESLVGGIISSEDYEEFRACSHKSLDKRIKKW